jgi:hypothetical protein
MLKKETDFLRSELAKERREQEITRKQLEMANMRCDLIFQEMLKHIEDNERAAQTMIEAHFSQEGVTPGIAKVSDLEYALE